MQQGVTACTAKKNAVDTSRAATWWHAGHGTGIGCTSSQGICSHSWWMCSGRADYFGLAVNRAARFLGAACGGQVLAERGLVEEVVQYWHSLVYKYALPASPCVVIHACSTDAAVGLCVHAYICTQASAASVDLLASLQCNCEQVWLFRLHNLFRLPTLQCHCS